MKRAVYAGSFDPITNGHIDVVERSLRFLDRIVIAVSRNPAKNPLFTVKERVSLIRSVFDGRDEIEVTTFDGLLVDFLDRIGIPLIIRGLRAVSDFEYEFQMALTNRKLRPSTDTLFLMPGQQYFYVSSSVVKEIAALGGSISCFVPAQVEQALKRKLHTVRGGYACRHRNDGTQRAGSARTGTAGNCGSRR